MTEQEQSDMLYDFHDLATKVLNEMRRYAFHMEAVTALHDLNLLVKDYESKRYTGPVNFSQAPTFTAPTTGTYNVSVGSGSAYGISSDDIQESINDLYAGILKERPTTTIAKPCVHEWKTYKGLSYQEDYCDGCGKTQNRRGLFE